MTTKEEYKNLLGEIEVHDVGAIRKLFDSGINPNDSFNDGRQEKPLIEYMISMYTRSPLFADCVQLFFDYGLHFKDHFLKAILLNDAASLDVQIKKDPALLHQTFKIDNAYNAMNDVSALHICAEFNHVECAQILKKYGVDANVQAGVDEFGFGGQSPIFHTVNQNSNASAEMLDWLIENGADCTMELKGLIWGETYPWQTMFPGVNPISFAMMGLMPMVHRSETQVKSIVDKLLRTTYGIDYDFPNVPNAYLKSF